MNEKPEHWLRGPVEGVPPLLQPVAHALLQSLDEVEGVVRDFPDALLWERPADVASVGFHLLHLPGMIERLFTYARSEALTTSQLEKLTAERQPMEGATTTTLLAAYRLQVDRALAQLRQTPEATLTEPRFVGRKKLSLYRSGPPLSRGGARPASHRPAPRDRAARQGGSNGVDRPE